MVVVSVSVCLKIHRKNAKGGTYGAFVFAEGWSRRSPRRPRRPRQAAERPPRCQQRALWHPGAGPRPGVVSALGARRAPAAPRSLSVPAGKAPRRGPAPLTASSYARFPRAPAWAELKDVSNSKNTSVCCTTRFYSSLARSPLAFYFRSVVTMELSLSGILMWLTDVSLCPGIVPISFQWSGFWFYLPSTNFSLSSSGWASSEFLYWCHKNPQETLPASALVFSPCLTRQGIKA